jgi:hypothetical protein
MNGFPVKVAKARFSREEAGVSELNKVSRR